jgi:hypothetical protein
LPAENAAARRAKRIEEKITKANEVLSLDHAGLQ